MSFGGDTRIRTGDQSFADSCLTTWLYRQIKKWSGKRGSNPRPSRWQRDALSTELFPQNQSKNIIAKFIIKVKIISKTKEKNPRTDYSVLGLKFLYMS